MPLDAVTLSALRAELQGALEGARVDKVQQPQRDMILLSLRGRGTGAKLLLSAAVGSARVHLTEESFENPSQPPMFCMLLRKHLTGARITGIEQPGFERMLLIRLDGRDELGVERKLTLAVEMMGRGCNILLIGEDGRIIDCIRRTDYAGDPQRILQPGMLYRLPPGQTKAPFFSLTGEERAALAAGADRDTPMDKWLLDSFSGLSPLICRELTARCGGDWEVLLEQMEALAETVRAGEFQPCLLRRNGENADFSFLPVTQYGPAGENQVYGSFSALLDAFYRERDRLERRRRLTRELTKTVKTLRDRLRRKLAAQQEELRRTEDMEQVRRTAELVTANLYRLKRGDRVLRCQDYYEPDCPEREIPLDPLKTPQQNAAALYKEYNKLKGAKGHLTELIGQNAKELDYLESVLEELPLCETEKDLAGVRRELVQTGILRPQKNERQAKAKPQAPLCFRTEDGLEVLVGRNNTQNDELTFRLARRTDYWFHVKELHGSHVILRCDGLEPPARSVEQAAALAVRYSQARDAGRTPVDYTMVRCVRKPSGALPGKVIYTGYKTLISDGAEAPESAIKS